MAYSAIILAGEKENAWVKTQKAIRNGNKKILALMHRMNVNYVEIEEIRKIDPDLKTFININTLEDLDQF
ncbi:MAG: hypothetical protein OIN83_13310 [Candidatus Methanoperedens sp.]|nr:hypothetical protein [Candidatus Methanoperedens sp.]